MFDVGGVEEVFVEHWLMLGKVLPPKDPVTRETTIVVYRIHFIYAPTTNQNKAS